MRVLGVGLWGFGLLVWFPASGLFENYPYRSLLQTLLETLIDPFKEI